MENPFRHRTAETPRALTPEQLAQAQVATEAAVIEGLGTRPAPETLDDEALMSAGFDTREKGDAIRREQATLYENLTTAYAERAERELATLVEGKEAQTPAVRAAIGDLEHAVESHKSLGMRGSPVLDAILLCAKMAEFEDRTTGLFSSEIQQAIGTYRAGITMLVERGRVPSAEGTRIQEEINSRKEP